MPVETFGFAGTRLITAAEAAFKEANELLGRKFQEEITSPKWQWPRGESPRDIVNLGQLRDSYDPEYTTTKVTHAWPVEHAIYAHEGATLENGTEFPPRRWTVEPLQQFEKAYAISLARWL